MYVTYLFYSLSREAPPTSQQGFGTLCNPRPSPSDSAAPALLAHWILHRDSSHHPGQTAARADDCRGEVRESEGEREKGRWERVMGRGRRRGGRKEEERGSVGGGKGRAGGGGGGGGGQGKGEGGEGEGEGRGRGRGSAVHFMACVH